MRTVLYEVRPLQAGWQLTIPGDGVKEIHRDKPAAIRRARTLGSSYEAWRIRVLDSAGKVETEIASRGAKRS